MTALIDWNTATDHDLAGAAAAGDREAFAAIYDRYADRLHDFCAGMLRDREAAADCVQETFCTAATRLSSLRDPAKLRPWLYAVSRSQALRHLERHRRERLDEDQFDNLAAPDQEPDELVRREELAALIDNVVGGLSDRDREVLELTYRHELDGVELGQALGVSAAHANTLVHRVRETVRRCLGAFLVARAVQADPSKCLALSEILDGWDGTLTVLMRKRIARHIENCPDCTAECQRRVNPKVLLAAPVFIPAPLSRERILGEVQLTCAASALPDADTPDGQPTVNAGSSPAGADGGNRRRPMFLAGLLLLLLALLTGGLVAVMHRSDAPVAPTGDSIVEKPSAPASPRQSVPTVKPTTPSPLPPPPSTPPSTPAASSPPPAAPEPAASPVPVRDAEVPIAPPPVTGGVTAGKQDLQPVEPKSGKTGGAESNRSGDCIDTVPSVRLNGGCGGGGSRSGGGGKSKDGSSSTGGGFRAPTGAPV